MADQFEVTAPVFTDASKSRVVDEHSPEAAFQLYMPGDRIPAEEAARLGLSKSGEPEHKSEQEAEHTDAGPVTPDDGEPAAGDETDGPAAPQSRPVVKDKAIRGPKG